MRAELLNLSHCTATFLSRAAANLYYTQVARQNLIADLD